MVAVRRLPVLFALPLSVVLLAAACQREAPPPPSAVAQPQPVVVAQVPAMPLPIAQTPTQIALPESYPSGFEFAALKARVDWRARVLAGAPLDDKGKASIERGRALFSQAFTVETGLGPYYNATSCLACHNQGGMLGHGAPDMTTHLWAGVYPGNDADDSKNPRLKPHYTTPGHKRFPMPKEFIPAGDRLPPQLMGLGWMEAVSAEQILKQPHTSQPEPGQHLEPIGFVPMKNRGARGTLRFGLKPGVATIDEFIIGALHDELGITTPNRAFDKDDDRVADPELTLEDVVDLANFVALSDPPSRALPAEHAAGLQRFKEVGCANCHWSDFSVEGKATPQFYSDLMMHDLGPALADKQQVGATPAAYSRTTALWSMHLNTGPYLHDGSASTVEAAILAHAGEATKARTAFTALDDAAKKALIEAVKNL